MGDMTFDESYNIREAVDFLNDKLGVREKLIQSARQFSEKNGAQKFGVTVKRFEDLLTDFLRLYQPIIEKVSAHREAVQMNILYQKDALSGVLGMIQVARGVEVLADRVRELETEAKGIEASITEKSKTLEKIEDLLRRARNQMPDSQRPTREESFADLSEQSDDILLGIRDTAAKPGAPRKAAGR